MSAVVRPMASSGASSGASASASMTAAWEQRAPLTASDHARISRLADIFGDRPFADPGHAGSSTMAAMMAASSAVAVGEPPGAPEMADGWPPTDAAWRLSALQRWADGCLAEADAAAARELLAGRAGFGAQRDAAAAGVATCAAARAGLGRALAGVAELDALNASVASLSLGLHRQADDIVAQVGRHGDLAGRVEAQLRAFNDVDQVAAAVGAPGGVAATEPRYATLLDRLDAALAFVARNRNFLAAAEYERRARALMRTALVSARDLVVFDLRSLRDALRRSPELHPFVVDFRKAAPRLRPACAQLERRADATPEIGALLAEAQQAYVAARVALLSAAVRTAVADVLRDGGDLDRVVRRGALLLSSLCRQEFELYHAFFDATSPTLVFGLEDLGAPLYHGVRPLVIRCHDTDALCQLTDAIRVEVLAPAAASVVAGSPGAAETQQVLSILFGRLLEDVQERLIFLAQSHVREFIATFAPGSVDMASFPERLENAVAQRSAAAVLETWYPTLRSTLTLLSKLYLSLDAAIFEGIAQEALTYCMSSLADAARWLETRRGWMHAFLFLIRHLLILREQLSPFEVDFAVDEVVLDFAPLRSAWQRFVSTKLSFFSREGQRSLLDMMANLQPNLQHLRLNSKKALEKTLVSQIELFLLRAIKLVEEPAVAFTEDRSTLPSAADAVALTHPRASPDAVRALVADCAQRIDTHLGVLLRTINLYIAFTANVSNRVNILRALRDNALVYLERFDAWLRPTAASDGAPLDGAAAYADVAEALDALRVRVRSEMDAAIDQSSE